jgi:hypothetical protein
MIVRLKRDFGAFGDVLLNFFRIYSWGCPKGCHRVSFRFEVSKVKWRSASESTACGRKTKPAVFANLLSFLLGNIRAIIAGHR